MKGNRKMNIIICSLGIIFLLIIYLLIPYSPIISKYENFKSEIVVNENRNDEVLKQDYLTHLPRQISNYILCNGFINTPKVNSMEIAFVNVDFKLKRDNAPIKIDYTHVNTFPNVNRIALIDTSIFGVPFQGIDGYINGSGSMKGVLAKHITLFDEGGDDFNRSSLLTYLAESIFMPSILIEDCFTFEEIDDDRIKVNLNYYGYDVSGVFKFNELNQVISFYTDERIQIDVDGTAKRIPWEVKYMDYIGDKIISRPSRIQIIWHYEDESSIYFDGTIEDLQYN